MSKKFLPAQKEYESLKSHFWYIFLNYRFRKSHINSADKKAILTGFVICLLNQQLGSKAARKLLFYHRKEFIACFIQLQSNPSLLKALSAFESNPDITIDEIYSYKKCFNSSIDLLINLLWSLKVDIKLSKQTFKEILSTGFIYLLYSLVECKMEKTLAEILVDPDYDKKVKMIMNNTKLFSNLKLLIMKECGNLTSDFIGLINGMTPILGKD